MRMQTIRGDVVISETGLTTSTSYDIDMREIDGIAIHAVYANATPAAKTFLAGKAEVITVNFEDKAASDAGDYFVLVDSEGLSWAASLDIDGNDAEPTGAIYTAIPAARKTHVDITSATNDEDVAALVLTALEALTGFTDQFTIVDGSDGTLAITSDIRANLTNAAPHNADDSGAGGIGISIVAGVDSAVNVTDNTITKVGHGLVTGLLGQFSSTATTPAGLTAATDFWVIRIDDDTFSVAESLALAEAGTAVDITDQGTASATHTFTPTTLAGVVVKLQTSNDGETFADLSSHTVTISAAGSTMWNLVDRFDKYVRVLHTPSAGAIDLDVTVHAKALA